MYQLCTFNFGDELRVFRNLLCVLAKSTKKKKNNDNKTWVTQWKDDVKNFMSYCIMDWEMCALAYQCPR